MAIEELENLDCNFSAVVEAVAKQCGSELAVRALGGDIAGNADHLADRVAQEEVIVGNLVHFSHSTEHLQKPSHIALRNGDMARDIAYPRRPKTLSAGKQRPDRLPDRFIGRREANLVAWQAHRRRRARPPWPGQALEGLSGIRGPADEGRASGGAALCPCPADPGSWCG